MPRQDVGDLPVELGEVLGPGVVEVQAADRRRGGVDPGAQQAADPPLGNPGRPARPAVIGAGVAHQHAEGVGAHGEVWPLPAVELQQVELGHDGVRGGDRLEPAVLVHEEHPGVVAPDGLDRMVEDPFDGVRHGRLVMEGERQLGELLREVPGQSTISRSPDTWLARGHAANRIAVGRATAQDDRRSNVADGRTITCGVRARSTAMGDRRSACVSSASVAHGRPSGAGWPDPGAGTGAVPGRPRHQVRDHRSTHTFEEHALVTAYGRKAPPTPGNDALLTLRRTPPCQPS